MMKNIRKALLGIVVIGGLMFVGCSNQDIPEGTIIESTQEDELAVDVYGNDLVLGYTGISLNEYMPKVSIKNIPLDRYNDILKLPEGTLDTEIAKSRAVDYLMGETDKLPNELVKKEETTEDNKIHDNTTEDDDYDDYYYEEPEVIGDAPESPEDLNSYEAPEGCCAKCGEKLGPNDVNLCAKCKAFEEQYNKKGYGLKVTIHWERDWYGNDFANFISAKLVNNDPYQYDNVVLRYTVHFTNGLEAYYETNLGSIGPNSWIDNITALPGTYTKEPISTIDNIVIVSWN